ncbi:unnamed protein product [Acanthoscelides obtectus]|uniref:26S proteasome non-ATPase regulatory subunit 9 n=1 Tax=Acanthoscelides obtectus TaxID=200917 RepID=A0A9P0QF01_ACAOB|nr:unnamed protein product [Acanthoscelides obtectus]CAK1681317.1 26S proteasome non-ATPase regulatory subunit 9 [Acanthoscelides obtectus]
MSRENIREQVLDLMTVKEKIEKEIDSLTTILTQNGVGMNEPLVDGDDFPIGSIDIYQVRNARHKIICLQNDHKNLMKQIEQGLQGYYGMPLPSTTQETSMEVNTREQGMVYKIPFAKVTIVSENGPAQYAGIMVNDGIVEFGSVNATNFKNITDIATVVQHSEGARVNIKLKRGDRFITLVLVPKKWTGKGLLGCNIVAL